MELPETLTYEKKGHIAIVTFNRPRAMNALTLEMMDAFKEVFAEFNSDDDLRVAILTGTGDKAFCAGADLGEAIPKYRYFQTDDISKAGDPTKRFLSDVYKPIIAAVNGFCLAGGVEILLGTDLRVASTHATFALQEVRWGIVPGAGSHIRLPRQIPWAVAMEILLLGQKIDAERAREVGLINWVVPPEELMDKAMEIAELVCANGPVAVRTAKEIAVRSLALEEPFMLEALLAPRAFRSKDAREGPRAFMEKRTPNFEGR